MVQQPTFFFLVVKLPPKYCFFLSLLSTKTVFLAFVRKTEKLKNRQFYFIAKTKTKKM